MLASGIFLISFFDCIMGFEFIVIFWSIIFVIFGTINTIFILSDMFDEYKKEDNNNGGV